MALEIATRENGVLINADASQIYSDLGILSARPSAAEEALVPHRLFGCIDGSARCSAAHWAALARAEIEAAHAGGQLPILVGGSGLYLHTLIEGIAPVPAISTCVRAAVRALEPAEVRAALIGEDPAAAARLHPNDRQRNARALEVIRATGRSILVWQQSAKTGGIGRKVRLQPQVIEVEHERLSSRIDARIDAMWKAGALAEVGCLIARRLPADLPVMRAIGVPPLAALLAGRCNEEAALARWRLDTRQYAKRQMTWLRNQCPGWQRISAPAA